MSMFCFQCQETFKNHGCTVRGVCGKTDDVANLQDALIFALKGMANYSSQLRKVKKVSSEIDGFLFKALFTTITNANFGFSVKKIPVQLLSSVYQRIGRNYDTCINS